MTQIVHGTIANLDPNAVCNEVGCAQYGQLIKNHSVVHRGTTTRGQKGLCPDCGGQMHNSHDKDLTISMLCVWTQTFDGLAGKTPVNAANLEKVVNKIKKGEITTWASRQKMIELVNGSHILTGAGAAGTTTGVTTHAPPTTPSTVSTPASSTSPSSATVPPAVTSAPVAPVSPARGGQIDDATRRKLASIFQGARVMP